MKNKIIPATFVALGRYVIALVILWTLITIGLVSWDMMRQHNDILELARQEARVAFEKDNLLRNWAAEHGGLYIHVTGDTLPNPYLWDMPDRDVTTPSGKEITLINPSYINRQLEEFEIKQFGRKTHVTSLTPMNPENAPDEWETSALKLFEKGKKEVSSAEVIGGVTYMRLMRPLITRESCLKCHINQPYKVGDLRGGISVSVAVQPLIDANRANRDWLIFGHGITWFFGLVIILAGYISLHAQISESEQSKSRLEEAHRELQTKDSNLDKAQEIAHLGNWDWDIVTNELKWSDEIYRIFGLIPNQFEATYPAFIDAIHPDDREMVQKAVHEAVYNKRPYDIEHRIVLPGGEVRVVNEQGEVNYDKDNKPVKMIGTVHDITERKRYEEELRESNATKDKFFSIIAHDLKNPFNTLLGASETLKENIGSLDQDELKSISLMINRNAVNAYSLLENLLTWSRSQLGRVEFNPQLTGLREIVRESIRVAEGQAESKSVKLINNVEDIPVYADSNLLRTILRNLLSNAVKYTSDGGSVLISSKQGGENIEVSVTDTGVGIPPEAIEKLFRIDTKYSTPGTAKETGTGLGLILCREFVEKHGGRIWAESPGDGKGTTFRFTLPGGDND